MFVGKSQRFRLLSYQALHLGVPRAQLVCAQPEEACDNRKRSEYRKRHKPGCLVKVRLHRDRQCTCSLLPALPVERRGDAKLIGAMGQCGERGFAIFAGVNPVLRDALHLIAESHAVGV